MKKILTPRFVASVRPRTTRTEYPDAGCAGLYLIVQPGGRRSWAHRFRYRGVNGKRTLGHAGPGAISLATARAMVTAHRRDLERGAKVTPVTPVTPFSGGGGDTIGAAAAAFLERHAYVKTRRSTAEKSERIFNREILPRWRWRKLGDIRKVDVIELVEDIAASGRGYHANRTLAQLSKFFNWLVARDVLAVSPVTRVERPFQEKARTRVLEDRELRALWLAGEGDPFGQALRVLVLTGARRNEVSKMHHDELDEGRQEWRLPSERSKNRREHLIPLSAQAWAIIEAQPRFADCPYVFSADGKKPVTGWDKAKDRISAKAGIDPDIWCLHDLRRTCASGMQKLGVSVPVIEKALNHVSGTFRGVIGVYQRHDYADEIRIALQKWADHVDEIVGGKPAKVFTLRGKRG